MAPSMSREADLVSQRSFLRRGKQTPINRSIVKNTRNHDDKKRETYCRYNTH
ncbi:hypothetical protein DPMN_069266 [Dreissena polymorpha]|uniref:Uncharacterized protein n=1 Tax=Dreissena polymorpha TaxID=45954 RepID=A0A9D4BMX6_DREPO|nr:hypothetical protein DPMN_069266 [Dreissena polymorpha]